MPWGNMGTIWAEMGLDNRNLISGMRESNRLIEEFDQDTSRRFKAIGDSFAKVGQDLSLKVTAPLALVGGVAAKASMDFETSITNVWTLMDVGADTIQNMGQQVEGLSKRIPQTATQLADGLYQVISASVPAEHAMYVLEASAKAASAGLSDTFTSVDAITSIINAYAMEATQAGYVSDLLFKTVEKGKTSYAELAGNIGQVASTAATAKVPIEQVTAALSTLTKVGVGTAEAATAVNQAILTFVRPTDDAKKKAKELGFELSATALQSKGLVGALNDMYQATGGDIEALGELIPNVRALKGVLGLTRQEMEMYTSDLEAMANAAGSTEKAFEKQAQTSASQAKLFKNEVSALTRAMGDELWPELLRGMDILKPFVKAFTDLPDPVKQSAVQFGIFAAALGPAMLLVGKLVALLSGPAGLVLAVSAAVFGITGLVRASKDLEGQIDRQVRAAREAIDSALENARAYKNQGDEIDRLIEEYHKLKAEAGDNYTEHEGLRQVIDKIVQLCPEAATGYDDMSRALMDNADGAKRYRDELYKLHEYELKIAASRAKYELPELKRQAEWLKPDIERTRKQLDELSPLYEKASRFWYKLQELNREEDIAIDKRDVAAQEAIAKQRELLQQEAVNAGIIATTMDPLGAQIYEIRKQYENTRDAYTSLLSTQQTVIKGIIELQGKQEELEEFGRRPEDSLSTEGEPGSGLQPPVTKEELDDFEALGQRIKELSDETHGVLRETWEKIEEGLKSDDIVARIYAEDQLGKLTRYLKDKIFEFGGDFEQAAAATAQYIRDGWEEISTEISNSDLRAEFDLLRTLGLVTLEEQLDFERELIEATEAGTAERSRAIQSYYNFLMRLFREAEEDELGIIRKTLQAQLLKYETMGEGASEMAMALKAAIAEIDKLEGKAGDVEDAWVRGLDNIEVMIGSMASSLRQLDDGWSAFFATILENIRFVKTEGQEMIDWGETLAETMAGIETAGFAGIGRNLGRVLGGGEATGQDYAGLAGAGIGAAIGGPIGAAIGQTLGEFIGWLFEPRDKPSAAIETRLGNLAKKFQEYEEGGEVYYKSGWNKLWNIKSRDIEKTFYDIAEALGTTIDDIASSLANAFAEETYEDFVDRFTKNLEQQTIQALITAFMASEVMKPLLDNLSETITKAAMDAELTDEEKAAIRGQISDIVDAAEPFYEMLQEMFPDLYGEGVGGRRGDVSRRGTMISEITGPTRDLLIETMRPLTVLDSMPVYFSSMERAIYEMRDAFIEYAAMAGVEVSGEMGFSQAIYEMRDALLEYTRTEAAITHKRALVMYEYHIQQVNVYPPRDATLWDILRTLQKKSDYAVIGSGAAKIGGAYTGGVI